MLRRFELSGEAGRRLHPRPPPRRGGFRRPIRVRAIHGEREQHQRARNDIAERPGACARPVRRAPFGRPIRTDLQLFLCRPLWWWMSAS